MSDRGEFDEDALIVRIPFLIVETSDIVDLIKAESWHDRARLLNNGLLEAFQIMAENDPAPPQTVLFDLAGLCADHLAIVLDSLPQPAPALDMPGAALHRVSSAPWHKEKASAYLTTFSAEANAFLPWKGLQVLRSVCELAVNGPGGGARPTPLAGEAAHV